MGARRQRLWFGGTRRSRSMRCRMCRRVGAAGWLRHGCRNSLLKLRRRQLIFRVQRWIGLLLRRQWAGSRQAKGHTKRRRERYAVPISHSSPPPFPPKHNIARPVSPRRSHAAARRRTPSVMFYRRATGSPSRGSRQLCPPTPVGLRRGSFHSPRERRLVEPGGVRTADLLNAIQALSQLSYGPFRDQTSVLGHQASDLLCYFY